MKGWIALDIDGTITLEKTSVPYSVIDCLRSYQKEGWQIVFATGRPFAFTMQAFSNFDFPYFLILQNGSATVSMPERQMVNRSYLPVSCIQWIEKAYNGVDGDFLIYSGIERGDFCYYRPHRFQSKEKIYLEQLQKRQKESWKEVNDFKSIQIDSFPLIKCFGTLDQMSFLASRLNDHFQTSLIQDPHEKNTTLLLITASNVTKGKALKFLLTKYGRGSKVIAAGDDLNDISLLEQADVKIAMPHSPDALKNLATFIAGPTKDLGIIHALKRAIDVN